MKEKIERFSKGDFEYELPLICLSEEEVRLTVEAGRKWEGSFTVSNSAERQMKGAVYSSNRLMNIVNPVFNETVNTISIHFDAAFLKAGEIIDGEISVISDCGEKTILFTVSIEANYCMTSLGRIKDLFQFTNLARMDWSEAKRVFRQEDFERVFLSNEERYRFIYRNLVKSISTSQALEEFLIAVHKKAVIRLDINKAQVEYQVTSDSITDKLILTKNNWGFAEIRVSTDTSFIQLEQKFLWADRFIGNTHQVAYSINSKGLQYGNNYGHIYIKTAHQTLTVDVVCRYKKESHKALGNRLLQKLEYRLVDNYLSFCLNRIELTEYLSEAEAILKQLPGPETNRFKELMKIHLSIVSGRTKITEVLLSDLALEEAALKRNSVREYCIFLYLNALYRKDESTIQYAADTIRSYYESGHFDWTILWLLLHVDIGYDHNKSRKLSDIKEQFDAGCRSPILYYEAVYIINEEPFLLRELNQFEIQVINFGFKNWILSKEAAQQYTYLCGKQKSFDPVIFNNLTKLYDEYGTNEILTVICGILIKGMKKSEKYFEWYRLGVEAQLRITELYEYYMYTISDAVREPLAGQVLLYYIYNSSIGEKKKAFLYANIIRNKDTMESIYRTYYKKMETFALKMLENHHISRDLAVLYRELLSKNALDGKAAEHLPYIIYRNELSCSNPNIINAIVMHKELGLEENAVLTDGKAQVDIFTGNAEIFLVDSFGNRFVESVEYSITPYLNSEEFEKLCVTHSENPMLLLHLFDRYQNYHVMNESAIELRKKVYQIEGLSPEFVTACCQTLIEYFYENYNDELLEYYLERLDIYGMHPAKRTKYLEYMVIRAFYDKALEALEAFGFEGIPVNRLVKLCSGWIQSPKYKKEQTVIVSLCYYLFIKKKYDEAILSYLVNNYSGATREMFRLWQAAKEFELDTHLLEERLLIQMLFTESYVEDSFLVFKNYYNSVTNHILVRAFLSYFAYKYLVHRSVVASDLFPIMKRELYYDENEVCLLAWLKYNASNKSLSDHELIFAEYNILRFVRKKVVLPFFQEYKNRLVLSEHIVDRCFISYHCDPRKQVYIHYRLMKEDGQDYITERMPDIYLGIHLKEFLLFYHEEVQYYITEESAEGTNITESFHIKNENGTPEDDNSKYNQINLMLIAREMQEDNTLLEMMEKYARQEFLIEECFTPIEEI